MNLTLDPTNQSREHHNDAKIHKTFLNCKKDDSCNAAEQILSTAHQHSHSILLAYP